MKWRLLIHVFCCHCILTVCHNQLGNLQPPMPGGYVKGHGLVMFSRFDIGCSANHNAFHNLRFPTLCCEMKRSVALSVTSRHQFLHLMLAISENELYDVGESYMCTYIIILYIVHVSTSVSTQCEEDNLCRRTYWPYKNDVKAESYKLK